MDKYEYQVCADQIKHLISERRYAEAMNIADTIDWRKVRSVSMLCTVSEVYKINKKYEEARDILLLAYDRHPNGRTIVYALCELAIKLNDVLQAKGLYEEFVSLAPEDTSRYILLYKLYEALDVSVEERIEVLEEFKKRDYRERWAYELAYLYHKIGQETRCVQECDELILWFGDGKYVKKAMDLKMQHTRLSKEQQLKYEGRQEPLTDKFMNLQNTPVQQIYDTDPQAGNPQEIPLQPYNRQYDQYGQVQPLVQGQPEMQNQVIMQNQQVSLQNTPVGMPNQQMNVQNTPVGMPNQQMNVQNTPVGMPNQQMNVQNTPVGMPNQQMNMQQMQQVPMQDPNSMQMSAQPMGMPVQRTAQMLTTSEIDSIQVQPVNVGMYNTMDLQNGLSENLKEFFEKENAKIIDRGVTLSADPEAYEQLYQNDTMDMTPVSNGPVIAVGGIEPAANEMDDVPGNDEDVQITTYIPINAEVVGQAVPAVTEGGSEPVNEDTTEDEPEGALSEEGSQDEPEEESLEEGFIEEEEAIQEAPEEIHKEEEEIKPEEEPVKKPAYELDEEDKDSEELADIYNDWNEQKKENEERRIQEAKEKSLIQTSDIMAKLKGVLPEIDDIARPTPTIEPVFKPFFTLPTKDVMKPAHVSIPLPVDEIKSEANEVDDEEPEKSEEVIREIEVDDTEAGAAGSKEAEAEAKPEIDFGKTDEAEAVHETIEEQVEEKEESPEEPTEDIEEEIKVEETKEEEAEESEIEETEAEESLVEETREEEAEAETNVEETEVEVAKVEETKEEEAGAEETTAEEVETEEADAEETEVEQEGSIEEVISEPEQDNEPDGEAVWESIEEKPAEDKEEDEIDLKKVEVSGSVTKGDFDYLNTKSNDDLYFQEIMNIDDSEDEAPQTEDGELTFSEDEEAARKAAFEVTSELPKYPYEGLDDYGEVEEIEVIEQPDGLEGMMRTDDIPLDDIVRANYESGVVDSAEEEEEVKVRKKKRPSYMKIEKSPSSKRDFDKEEQLVFGRFEGIEWLKAQIVGAIDNISMEPSHGNVVVVGSESSGRRNIAIDIVKVMQQLESGFKGKVAKISGEALNKKDIPLTVKKLKKGALIIENAQDLTPSSARLVAEALELETEQVLVVMEGDKEGMEAIFDSSRAIMERVFNARIELQDYTTDDLVSYGKGYAKEQEYAIDEMGVLAMYRRIGDMQTLEHTVTLEEVREIVDNAIKHVDKKNMSHFMDVLLAKRYDDDDFIILREKDFIV